VIFAVLDLRVVAVAIKSRCKLHAKILYTNLDQMACICRSAAKTTDRPACGVVHPLCHHACPSGYKYKPDGCMTCRCVQAEPAGKNRTFSLDFSPFIACI